MNCNEVNDNLSLYIDDELSEEEKKSMDEHIKNCLDCSKELEEYKKIIQALRELPDEEPPAGYCKRLNEKLLKIKSEEIKEENEMPEVVKAPMKGNRVSRWVKYGGLAAALVLIFFVYGLNRSGMDYSDQEMTSNIDEASNMQAVPGEAPAENFGATLNARDIRGVSDNYTSFDGKSKQDAMESEISADETTGQENQAATENRELKIIKTGDIYVQTKDYNKFLNEMMAKISSMGGYIENNNTEVYQVYENDKLMHGNLKIRVPKENFDEAVSYLEETTEIRRKNINETDVTKEYYEKDNKVKNLEVQEQHLRELFEKATTVEEMLQIENELRRVRTEIDFLNLSLADIDDRASMSTIDLEVEEVREVNFELKSEKGVLERAKEGFINTVNRIVRGTGNLIVNLISSSPILVPAIIIFVILFMKVKKYWKKKL